MRQALAKAGVKLERGDAVLIRTGWSKLMGKENERYGTQNAGIGIAAAQWRLAQEPMLIAEALAAARAYEFAFIVQPLKLKGATGSAVAPMAIR